MTDQSTSPYIRWFETLTLKDSLIAGKKNASLGEMIQTLKDQNVRIPSGFAVTTEAYRDFLKRNELDEKIRACLADLKPDESSFEDVADSLQDLFLKASFPEEIAEAIVQAYQTLAQRQEQEDLRVAVRSSIAANDLPEDASFVGQQESFLNVTGDDELLAACCKCYASLFSARALKYRYRLELDHHNVGLSIGVQQMIGGTGQAGSGVMFTIDPETGFPDVVVITAAWGLGTGVTDSQTTPDEYRIFTPLLKQDSLVPIMKKTLGDKDSKVVYAAGGDSATKTVETTREERDSFVLSDEDILHLARLAQVIEAHYGEPMNIEWAEEKQTNQLYILEAQPETSETEHADSMFKTYRLREKGETLLTGLAVGEAIATGQVRLVKEAGDLDTLADNTILVTQQIDPDWISAIQQAAGVITDQGGRTSHAAVISRELGLPAVIDTEKATEVLKNDQWVTVSCAEGDQGYIYEGELAFETQAVDLDQIPETAIPIMMNIANPAAAFRWWRLPCEGVGLARMEFLINNVIKIHPMALVHFEDLEDQATQEQIEALIRGYEDKTDYFVDHLAYGIAQIAASQYPHPVVVRTSDFKTNEYAGLIGGRTFEPEEANPMLGFRGAARYYSDRYRAAFALECRAIKRVREEMGLDNVVVMIPFCRTPEEADKVLEVMATNGLVRGQQGLQIYVMAEIPSNIILADQFAQRFDGFSIGSNDLTQLVLGVDRDSDDLADLFEERHEALKRMISSLIETAHTANRTVGICGQAPSDYPDFAEFLVEAGIDSISLNPDSVIEVKQHLGKTD